MNNFFRISKASFFINFLCMILSLSAISKGNDGVSNQVRIEKAKFQYDKQNKINYVKVSLRNISKKTLLSPLRVVIEDINTSDVTIANADGYTVQGKPYFEYSLKNGVLLPRKKTGKKTWKFSNPNLKLFRCKVNIYTDEIPPQPPTVNLNADPQTIIEGETTTLSWSSTNADACEITPNIGTVDCNSSQSITPAQTTIYTITATGPGGVVTDNATITVNPPPEPPTVNISVDPQTIIEGESAALSWTSANADTCEITPDIGTVDCNSSQSITPAQTTTYTITATGAGGTVVDNTTLTVNPPPELPTVNISTDFQTITEGETATLSWTSANADTCEITPDIGTVDCNSMQSVSPVQTTTYTITATGPGGVVTDNATITVNPPPEPPTVNISVDPQAIIEGESATLAWISTEAYTCEISPDIGAVDVVGDLIITPTGTITYTITATGPGGTATDTVTIVVEPIVSDLPIVNVYATPDTITAGGSATLSWTVTNATSVHVDNGIGLVPAVSSIEVSPENTTSYTITATGTGGSVNEKVLISVTGAPAPQEEGSFGELYQALIPEDSTVEKYEKSSFSIITGQVNDVNDLPVPEVLVNILDHPEYGTAKTNNEGKFSIPVEGGWDYKVVFKRSDLITVYRAISVPGNDIVVVETIKMIKEDINFSTITFDGNPDTVITHQSSVVADASGSRALTMILTGDNKAYAVDENGADLFELTTIKTRATEFTTPESMPAVLPSTTAFTYCAELKVDGVENVRFDKPVVTYVDNFLGFDVGSIVPVGYYDRDAGDWVASQNGVVVKLLDTNSDGIVDALDADGDSFADDLNGNGSFDDEVIGLEDPSRYIPGDTYWRVEISHFTPWDFNWPSGAPVDAIGPNPLGAPIIDQQSQYDCNQSTNSFVNCQSRIYHEDILIPGTNLTLHYASNRVNDYKTIINVPVSGDTVPASLEKIIVKLEIAGRSLEQILDPLPNQVVSFEWDGQDYLGNWVGKAKADIKIGFLYSRVYYDPFDSGNAISFGVPGVTSADILARDGMILWSTVEKYISSLVDKENMLADGWALSNHVIFKNDNALLAKGNGSVSRYTPAVISLFAGNGILSGGYNDGGPATNANLYRPRGLVLNIDDSIVFADSLHNTIRRIDANGIITTLAGNWNFRGFYGDGGLAINAALSLPSGIAIDDIGNIYFVDRGNYRIRKIDTNGIITTIAGNGIRGYSGDGGSATQAEISDPSGLSIDNSGNIYFAEYVHHCIRKIDTNGIITTIAGIGNSGFSGDGGLANAAELYSPLDVEIDDSGDIYILDSGNARIRKIDTNNIITTIAGTGAQLFGGDSGSALTASFSSLNDMSVDKLGNIYIADGERIRKINSLGIINTIAGGGAGSVSGPAIEANLEMLVSLTQDSVGNIIFADYISNQIWKTSVQSANVVNLLNGDVLFHEKDISYLFSSTGKHKQTIEQDTGKVLQEFGYDVEGRLVSVADHLGNQITIQRNASGVPTSIVSPDGLTTDLTIDSNNHLAKIIYPDNSQYNFEYTTGGLMTKEIEPEGNQFTHVFDPAGRITDIIDEEGGFKKLSRQMLANGDVETKVETAEGNITTYLDHTELTGEFTSTVGTLASGTDIVYAKSDDGLSINEKHPDGMEVDTTYGVDPGYGFEYIKEVSAATPAGLRVQAISKILYEDTDADDVTDKITRTLAINDKATTSVHNVLTSQKTITSPEGRTATSVYDPNTLLVSSVSVPGINDVAYSYDAKGRLTSTTTGTRSATVIYDPAGNVQSTKDPMNNTTTFDYDAVGRTKAIHRADSTSIFFDYDANGNVTVLTDPGGHVNSSGYDNVNLNTKWQTPITVGYNYQYDKDRRLVQTTSPSGKIIRNVYDTTQLIQVQTPEGNVDISYIAGNRVNSITKGSELIAFGYDGSLVTSKMLTGTLNQTLGFTYNNDFSLTAFSYAGATNNFAYDNDGLLTQSGDFAITHNVQNGLPEAVTDSTLSVSRTFNSYGEVEGQDNTVNSAAVNSWAVVYDDNGRIATKTETVAGITVNYVYEYDSVGRLQKVHKDGAVVEEYQYNNGIRSHEVNTLRGINRSLSYDQEDRILTAGPVVYQHNADGFLQTRVDVTESTSYSYSSRGELLQVNLPDGSNIEYVHDALGRRIAKKINGSIIEKYLWNGMTQLLAVYDAVDNLVMRFNYADSLVPFSMIKNGVKYYLTHDQVGSLRAITDATGTVVKRIDYDSFGNIIVDSDSSFTIPFGFAGGMHDRDTNLVRFGYRDYMPETGRWTAKDPIGFAGGDVDLFGYTSSDPINFVDPWGLQCLTEQGMASLVALTTAYLLYEYLRNLDVDWDISSSDKDDGKLRYWQYYPAGNPLYASPWFISGYGNKPPYATGRQAREALNLPPWNPGTAVRQYKPKSPAIAGPRKPKPRPEWGHPNEGTGWEYYDGPFFPD